MPDDDLEHEPLVRNQLDHDELRDEILSRNAKRLPDDAPFAQQSGRLQDRADDRVHPPRLLRDVEHHCGDGLGRRGEDRLHGDVETPVLRREPPQCPEDREDREDRTEKRCPDEELDDHKGESGNRELLRLHGSRLEHEVVAAVYPGAVDEKCSDQESHDQNEKPGLYQQEEHARPSLDSGGRGAVRRHERCATRGPQARLAFPSRRGVLVAGCAARRRRPRHRRIDLLFSVRGRP